MTAYHDILKKVTTFLIITTLISTGIFIWIFNGAGDSLIAVLPMMFTPGVSAFITAFIFKEKINHSIIDFTDPQILNNEIYYLDNNSK